MSKPKHTPGPWFVDIEKLDSGDWRTHIRAEGSFVGQSLQVCEVNAYVDYKLDGANAALIAAAPEMLKALEVLVGHAPNGECEAIVRALIARARGEL